MSKCANCSEDAMYVYEMSSQNHILYCDNDLPGFLRGAQRAGHLRTTEVFEAQKQSVLAALAAEKFETGEEEEAPAPKPSKKTPVKPKAEKLVEEQAEVVVETPVEDVE